MSGHLRFCFVAFFLAGLSTSPAASNPFDALFNSAPAEATAPAPAEEECLPQPGKSTTDVQHWVYRYDGHRKCWFQAAEGTATAKKPIHHAAGHRVAAPNENESPLRNRKAVVDAREELLSSAPTEAAQPTPLAPEKKVVDAVAVPVTGGAALVPPAPVAAQPAAADQLTPNHPTPLQVDVETFMAAPSASDAVDASPRVTPVVVPNAEVGVDGGGGTATWLGMLLIALGLVSLLSSSRILRGGRAGRDISPSEAGVGGHRRTPEPSFAFGPNTFNRPAVNEKLFRPRSARPAI
jgi:hypothetical protein